MCSSWLYFNLNPIVLLCQRYKLDRQDFIIQRNIILSERENIVINNIVKQ